MKKRIIREYFSIPNLMGYLRILLIPVYLYLYVHAETTRDYYIAAAVMFLSFMTDFFDGKIARKFNQITEFGKILDPIADKLTQGALVISFSFRYPAMAVLLAAFLVKECTMGMIGAWMMKKGYRMDPRDSALQAARPDAWKNLYCRIGYCDVCDSDFSGYHLFVCQYFSGYQYTCNGSFFWKISPYVLESLEGEISEDGQERKKCMKERKEQIAYE